MIAGMGERILNAFNRRTAVRIAVVSFLLAAIASPIAWFVTQENTEEATVSLAMEESKRMLQHFDALALVGEFAAEHAQLAARTLAGGLFDIAEIYDHQGIKLAEAMTEDGGWIEKTLPKHGVPGYRTASYDSIRLPDGRWAMRIFVPLQEAEATQAISGYFEGVRIMPAWQREQMLTSALTAALMIGLASLLCGAVIYPVVVHLSAENEKKTREVLDSHISMMEALGRAIAKRDSDTGAHNYRVALISAQIAERMGFSSTAMQSLIAGSFLHDVGKIGIPDAILLKPGRLDEGEFEIMRTHVGQGEEIVTGMGWLDGANAVVAGHHEKWNGQGYPRRLKGDEIPLSARIFAVADVFDALCSRRPYKEPMSFDAAMAILERDTGSHFDPSVMDVFRQLAAEIHAALMNRSEEEVRALLTEQVRKHFAA